MWPSICVCVTACIFRIQVEYSDVALCFFSTVFVFVSLTPVFKYVFKQKSNSGKIGSSCVQSRCWQHNEMSRQPRPAELKTGRGGTSEDAVRLRRHLSSVKKLYDTHINHLHILTALSLSCVLHSSVCYVIHVRQVPKTGGKAALKFTESLTQYVLCLFLELAPIALLKHVWGIMDLMWANTITVDREEQTRALGLSDHEDAELYGCPLETT